MRKHSDERRALRDCRRGRVHGLSVLYELYKDRVFRTCFRILGDRELAEDTTQEVFLRVFNKIHGFNRRSAFSTWLYRLAVNHTLNVLEQKRRWEGVSAGEEANLERLADPSPTPERALVQKEYRSEVQRLLSPLSPEHRTVLVLREIEELAYREIAEVLDIPVGTVMSRLSRAWQALRRASEKAQEERRNRPSHGSCLKR